MSLADTESIATAWRRFIGIGAAETFIDHLVANSQMLNCVSGVNLVSEYDSSNRVFIVVTGELKAVLFSENGHEIWLSGAGPGDLIGELGVLTGRQRTTDVVAVSNCSLISLSNQNFMDGLSTNGAFALAVAKLLAERVRVTSIQLAELVSNPVATRLHLELIRQGRADPKDDEKYHVDVDHTVSNLAVRIHATREATSRAMTQLEKRGLVHRAPSGWSIIAPRF